MKEGITQGHMGNFNEEMKTVKKASRKARNENIIRHKECIPHAHQ